MKKIIYILLVIAAVVIIGRYLYQTRATNVAQNTENQTQNNQESTTTETTNETAATTTKSVVDKNLGISYSYTDNFYFNNNLTEYVHPVEWPPKVDVKTAKLVCPKPDTKNINGSTYCKTVESEGAAGSTYTTYTYEKQFDKKIVSVSFITRTPQCMNFDGLKQSDCKNEVANLSIDNMVDKIFSTVVLAK